MHHIVAVEVKLQTGEQRFFLTWGRIQDPVDPGPLARLVLSHATRFAIDGEPRSARVLWSLHPAVDTPGFWDAFSDMCQQRIPFGEETYVTWREGIAAQQERGHEIWYLGHWRGDASDEQPSEPHATLADVMAGYPDAKIKVGQIGTVEFIADDVNGPVYTRAQTGFASVLQAGRYRVRVVRLWEREPFRWCAAGDLLDDADAEIAREAGTSGLTAADVFERAEGVIGSLEALEQRFAAFNPRRILFARADFRADAEGDADPETVDPHPHPGLPASIPPDAWS